MKFHSVQQGNPKWQPIVTPAPRNPLVVQRLPLVAPQRNPLVVLVAPFVKRSQHAAAPLL
jgi:hypothetical protein